MHDKADQLRTALDELGAPAPTLAEVQAYRSDLMGFQGFLDHQGIRHFSAIEVCSPRWPEGARKLGWDHFVPPNDAVPEYWLHLALNLTIAEKMRAVRRRPINCYNAWRPGENWEPKGNYNLLVAKSKGSDHPVCAAIDLDFGDPGYLDEATAVVLGPLWRANKFDLSLGIGDNELHLGTFNRPGQYRWKYSPRKAWPSWM